jgi:hypothetical protein
MNTTNISKYITAVNRFNSLKSFNIVLPKNEEKLNYLTKYTTAINDFTDLLHLYENKRLNGDANNDESKEESNHICKFVVHINQITNDVKPFDPNDDEYLNQ